MALTQNADRKSPYEGKPTVTLVEVDFAGLRRGMTDLARYIGLAAPTSTGQWTRLFFKVGLADRHFVQRLEFDIS